MATSPISSSLPSPEPSRPPTIKLEPRERLLRRCLLDCAETLKEPPLEIRFVGGWVRDKLLGHASDDIDAALSSMSGKEFGSILLDFYAKRGHVYGEMAVEMGIYSSTTGGDGHSNGSGVGVGGGETKKRKKNEEDMMEPGRMVVVEEDADKSKHLAVAKMKLFGLEVDLVNLRTEVYAADSRTPMQMEIGTAEEDAQRRDATINALFYNLHTDRVEDLTGKGLTDLRAGVMRTPLDPLQTFRDDPLRILRLIRFASRLGFRVDPEAETAMRDPAIQQDLRSKISRERVRAEIVKAFEGSDPAEALRCIHRLRLFSTCFASPAADDVGDHRNDAAGSLPPLRLDQIPRTCSNLTYIMSTRNSTFRGLGLGRESRSVLWLLAAYTPWALRPVDDAIRAIKEGIKATVREAKLLHAAISNRAEISILVFSVYSVHLAPEDRPDPFILGNALLSRSALTRGKIAMTIRRWGPTWGPQVLYALLHDLLQLSIPPTGGTPSAGATETTTVLTAYFYFLAHLSSLNLLPPSDTYTDTHTDPKPNDPDKTHLNDKKVRLKSGADIDLTATESSGQTPLHIAAESGHQDIVKLLLQAGADIDATTGGSSGQTPSQIAAESGHQDVVNLLLRARADAKTPKDTLKARIPTNKSTNDKQLATAITPTSTIHNLKPLLNGRQIIAILDRPKPGPGNRLAAELVLHWQFDHPGTGMDPWSRVDGSAATAGGRDDEVVKKQEEEEEECARWLRRRRDLILDWERRCEAGGGRGAAAVVDRKVVEGIVDADVDVEGDGDVDMDIDRKNTAE